MASVGVNVEVNFEQLGEALYSQNYSIFSNPAFISKLKTNEFKKNDFGDIEEMLANTLKLEQTRFEHQRYLEQEKVRQEQVRQEQIRQESMKYFQPKRQLGGRKNTTSPTIHLQTPSMALKQKMQQQYLQEQQYFQEQQHLQYLQRQYYNANGMIYYSK